MYFNVFTGMCTEPPATMKQSTKVNRTTVAYSFIKCYVKYSVAQKLRVRIEPQQDQPDQPDPELDYVPQSAIASAKRAAEHRNKLQCVSAWIWCK